MKPYLARIALNGKRRSINIDFADELQISIEKLTRLCSNYYCMWLLRQIWCYSDANPAVKRSCVSLAYDLVHSHKGFFTLDFLLVSHSDILSSWLREYNREYRGQHRLFQGLNGYDS